MITIEEIKRKYPSSYNFTYNEDFIVLHPNFYISSGNLYFRTTGFVITTRQLPKEVFKYLEQGVRIKMFDPPEFVFAQTIYRNGHVQKIIVERI